MPTIIVNGQTAFHPAFDADKIRVFFTGLKAIGCSHFFDSAQFSFNGIEFDAKNFLCEQMPNEETIYCTFFGDKLGSGSFGEVYSVIAKVKVTPTSYEPYDDYSQKAVKVQTHCTCDPNIKAPTPHLHNPIERLKDENEISAEVPHLGVMPATQINIPNTIYSYMFMNRFKGEELYNLLERDQTKKSILSLRERILLSLELLRALETQVSKLRIIHGDIKPENIMIESIENPGNDNTFAINIVDYCFAKKLPPEIQEIADIVPSGSPCYIAPEILMPKPKTSPASDLYSLYRVLQCVWGGVDSSYYDGLKGHLKFMVKTNKVENLFNGLPKDQRETLSKLGLGDEIKKLIQQGLDNNQSRRGTVEDSIRAFELIHDRFMATGPCAAPQLQQHVMGSSAAAAAASGPVNSGPRVIETTLVFFKPLAPGDTPADDKHNIAPSLHTSN